MVAVLQADSIRNYICCVLIHDELIRFLKPIEANNELYFVDKLLIVRIVWELYKDRIESATENELDKLHIFACSLQIARYQLLDAIE